jgi:signal transduction histidine kinase
MAKLLLVDDREDNLVAIESILGADGYVFVRASSGREALKVLLTEFDFALILMDVSMPNLDGFETAALIYEREKLKHIPIIFITALHYGEENIYKGYRSGAVDYIYKPINPDLLRAKVAVFIDLYRKNHLLHVQRQKLEATNKNLEQEVQERKNSEEKVHALNLQLLQSIEKIQAANKDLDRFAFMASHDLQEPLRKIRMFTSRMQDKYSQIFDEEAKVYLSRIQNSVNRMQMLIQDILTFSKISLDKKEFVSSDLNAIVEDVLSDLDSVVKEKRAEIVVDKLPMLRVNPNLARPLFSNLIGNALKYAKKDVAPVVRVYSDINYQTGSKYCRIFFNDNGIGFEQKYAEQIFDMFKRLHQQNEYEGTGIGLALCKKIVEEHEGYISAISTLGVGSTFIVSLPMTVSEVEAHHVATA